MSSVARSERREIDLRSSARSRWQLAIPMLLIGGVVLWFGNADTIGTMIFGAGLVVVAFLMLAERHALVADVQTGVLIRERGILLPFRRVSFAIPEIEYIALTSYHRRGRRGRDGQKRYRLQVNGRDVLTDQSDEWQVRRTGERLCVAIGVPLDNRVYGGRSVRKPDELDLPLAERWRRSGKAKERPPLPAGSQIVVQENGPDAQLSMLSERGKLKWLALFAAFIAVFGAVIYTQLDDTGARLFFYLFFGLAAVILALCALGFSGHSRLTFTRTHVSFRQGLAPWTRSIELASIEELIVARDGLYLVSDSASLWMHWAAAKADSGFLEDYVEYEIARRFNPGSAAG